MHSSIFSVVHVQCVFMLADWVCGLNLNLALENGPKPLPWQRGFIWKFSKWLWTGDDGLQHNYVSKSSPHVTSWGPWTKCSVTCGTGKRVRRRTCDGTVTIGVQECGDAESQSASCTGPSCQGENSRSKNNNKTADNEEEYNWNDQYASDDVEEIVGDTVHIDDNLHTKHDDTDDLNDNNDGDADQAPDDITNDMVDDNTEYDNIGADGIHDFEETLQPNDDDDVIIEQSHVNDCDLNDDEQNHVDGFIDGANHVDDEVRGMNEEDDSHIANDECIQEVFRDPNAEAHDTDIFEDVQDENVQRNDMYDNTAENDNNGADINAKGDDGSFDDEIRREQSLGPSNMPNFVEEIDNNIDRHNVPDDNTIDIDESFIQNNEMTSECQHDSAGDVDIDEQNIDDSGPNQEASGYCNDDHDGHDKGVVDCDIDANDGIDANDPDNDANINDDQDNDEKQQDEENTRERNTRQVSIDEIVTDNEDGEDDDDNDDENDNEDQNADEFEDDEASGDEDEQQNEEDDDGEEDDKEDDEIVKKKKKKKRKSSSSSSSTYSTSSSIVISSDECLSENGDLVFCDCDVPND